MERTRSDEEVSRYAGFDYDVRYYTGLEDRALTQEMDLYSYVHSRKAFGPDEMVEVESRLRSFEALTRIMGHLGGEAMRDFKKALPDQGQTFFKAIKLSCRTGSLTPGRRCCARRKLRGVLPLVATEFVPTNGRIT